MNKYDKIAIVDAALAGHEPEIVPFSVWFHFPDSMRAGKACADAHVEHLRRYDLDYLKVMNDNPYDMPASMPVITMPKEWLKIEPLKPDAPGFVAELEAVALLQRAIGKEVRFCVTVFGPLATAMKLSDRKAIDQLREDPECTEKGLAVITESLSVFARKAVEVGASGIFLACSGPEPSMLSHEEYNRFIKPYDVKLLSAVADAPFNMVHVHGTNVYLDLFTDYPANSLNWPSHKSDYPISKVRKLTDKCLIAGIDERGPFVKQKMRATIAEVSQSVAESGRKGFMVGTECTIPPETPPDFIRAIRDLVVQL